MKRPTLVALLLCFSLVLLTGCGNLMRTPYQRPDVTIPDHWTTGNQDGQPHRDHWWKAFDDPILDQLMDQVLLRNNDLAAASVRIRRAALQAELADSALLPSLKVAVSASHSRQLQAGARETNTFAGSVGSVYQADLWGTQVSDAAAARWEALAVEADRGITRLEVMATTATFYWQIGYFNQRIELATASLAYAHRTLELVKVQQAAGAATSLEVLEAQRSVAAQEAGRTLLFHQLNEARNGLAILLDQPPSSWTMAEPTNLHATGLPEVAAGLPASLLARRPDLRAAEARLRSVLAAVDATRTSFYPSITLSTSLGRSSEELSRIISNPIGTLAADLALPFFEWRDMGRTVNIAEADYDQAVIAFRQTLYTAFKEVENSLSARFHYREQAMQLAASLEMARRIEEVYRVRYQAGGSPLKSWLDAQENRRQAEISLADNRLNQLLTHIALIKSLGGDPDATMSWHHPL